MNHENASVVIDYIKTINRNNKTTYTAYVEVDPESFSIIMKHKKIFIEWERCKVFEHLNINQFYNCNGYNHNSKKCTNPKACANFAGDHCTKECISNKIECINCTRMNIKFNKNFKINHAAHEITKCSTYKDIVKIKRSNILYNFD